METVRTWCFSTTTWWSPAPPTRSLNLIESARSSETHLPASCGSASAHRKPLTPLPRFAPAAKISPSVGLCECGYLASPETLGLSKIWSDPALLAHRIDACDLVLSRRLASSGIAEVWRGLWRGAVVAVKRLRSEDQTITFAEQFAEASTQFVGVMHPKIVFVVGVSWIKAQDIQVVMEFLEGGDLRSLLKSEAASSLTRAESKCQLAIDVAEALDYLHSTDKTVSVGGLVPRNILLDTNGQAKHSLLHVSRYSTLQTLQYGEVDCIAPETLRGDALTASVDVYAFGVLLTELDTTEEPFERVKYPDGRAAEAPWIAVQTARGSLTPAMSRDCPPAIAELARECLAIDPENRPDATRIAYRLHTILKNEL